MTDSMEGLGASSNRFTRTDSSLEKEREVAGDAEGLTPTAHSVGSMHETGRTTGLTRQEQGGLDPNAGFGTD